VHAQLHNTIILKDTFINIIEEVFFVISVADLLKSVRFGVMASRIQAGKIYG
jgi:hypothetical protein